ncbi:hypothetical protein [Amycolatopsis sp. NPDC051071]
MIAFSVAAFAVYAGVINLVPLLTGHGISAHRVEVLQAAALDLRC